MFGRGNRNPQPQSQTGTEEGGVPRMGTLPLNLASQDHFELVLEYQPIGDQSQAIAELVEGCKGKQFRTLAG